MNALEKGWEEIMTYSQETIDYVREAAAELETFNFRLASLGGDERQRDDYARDYARILYSASFRRLQGKMQLLGIDNTHFFRNRLTHSMEVAQIARGIAGDLQLDNTFVVEACSLAHDLGNPPIGHHGESVLHQLVADIGGFEGNAQTLRILRTLEKKHHAYRGLDLTFRTLLGVVKYYRKLEGGKAKKFIYDEDYAFIQQTLQQRGMADFEVKTLDMQIMDLSDEIAYAAHDLEDCLSEGLFSIDDLLYEFKIHNTFNQAYDVLYEIVEHCRAFAYQGKRLASSEEYAFLFRKELTSKIVNTLIRDIAYIPAEGRLGFRQYGLLSNGLKKVVFHIISRRPFVQLYEKRGEKVLRGLYEVYCDKQLNGNLELLPAEYRLFENEDERRRNVIDFISGMMDQFALQEYAKYYGEGSLETLI